tara:strand:+ start:205 stop:444 length:240 start_codon:yes stop_codon:yes gene_type:complete
MCIFNQKTPKMAALPGITPSTDQADDLAVAKDVVDPDAKADLSIGTKKKSTTDQELVASSPGTISDTLKINQGQTGINT